MSYSGLFVLGLLLLAGGVVLRVMASEGMDAKMPTQVPPKRFAKYPIIIGLVAVLVAVIGLIAPP